MRNEPHEWLYRSSSDEGLHEIISPDNSACRQTWIWRLNLSDNSVHQWYDGEREISAAVIQGRLRITGDDIDETLGRFDSFYLPAGKELVINALEPAMLYIGGAPYEGRGSFFTRKCDLEMPLGEIHQVHGKPPYERHVFMCINQEAAGSRLITGLTWGNDGAWTSWPPHQHTQDLEEVYCYFDIPEPMKVLHLGYRKPGELEAIHAVSTGDCVVVPEGYHPTVAMPGVRSAYFWVMTAHRPESRRYDLAINDPVIEPHCK